MKFKIFAAAMLLAVCIQCQAQNSISGFIYDAADSSVLIGATVSIPDLKTGSVSDETGFFSINNLPAGNTILQITYVGYDIYSTLVNISGNNFIKIYLHESVLEQNEVVVTGVGITSEIKRTPSPISVIDNLQLQQTASTNLIDAIAHQPGISQITTGPGISKPEIRGLGYNRLVVLNDGMRQEGQQWGDEHGVEVDEFSADKIEVLKGPGSIMYGSDAIAGVINILSPDPVEEGKISANFQSEYATNNGLFGNSLHAAGHNQNFIWSMRISNKQAHCYKNNADGFVFNSGFRETDFNGYAGIKKTNGSSVFNFSYFNQHPGMSEGNRDSSGFFIKPVVVDDSTLIFETATLHDFKNYNLFVPYQQVQHFKLMLKNVLYAGSSKFYLNLGAENNQRKEFADALFPDQYGLYFNLNSLPFDVKFSLPTIKNMDCTIGTNGFFQQNKNLGTEFLIPNYQLFECGAFVFAQKQWNKFSMSGGTRLDFRNLNTKSLWLNSNGDVIDSATINAQQKFQAIQHNDKSFSFSIGTCYLANKTWSIKANIARGFRAPNIAELSANGVHEGTYRYELGNKALLPEKSLQEDLGFELNTAHVHLEVALFQNNISHFIFLKKVTTQNGKDSMIYNNETQSWYPVYSFAQGQANLWGGEISMDIHPHPFDWLHWQNALSYVSSTLLHQPDSTKYLPFTPPLKITTELKASATKSFLFFSNAFAAAGVDYSAAQTKIYWANKTETATPSYWLLHASLGGNVCYHNKVLFSLDIIGNNLLNKSYQDHLSRLKYAPENFATGKSGIYNMGRNVTVKINVPFDVK